MSAIATQFSFHRTASGRNIIEQQAGAEDENQVFISWNQELDMFKLGESEF